MRSLTMKVTVLVKPIENFGRTGTVQLKLLKKISGQEPHVSRYDQVPLQGSKPWARHLVEKCWYKDYYSREKEQHSRDNGLRCHKKWDSFQKEEQYSHVKVDRSHIRGNKSLENEQCPCDKEDGSRVTLLKSRDISLSPRKISPESP